MSTSSGGARASALGREDVRLLVASEVVERLGEQPRDGAERVLLPDAGERLVRASQLTLGGLRRPRIHLDPPCLERHASGSYLEAELVQSRAAPGDELARAVDLTVHRVQRAEEGREDGLGLTVARHLPDRALAALDALVHRDRPDDGGRGVARCRCGLLAHVAGEASVLERMLGRRRRLRELTRRPVGRGEEAPGLGEPGMITRSPRTRPWPPRS